MAKINELNSGQGNVEVEGVIKEVGEPRTFNKFGKELTVVSAILEDDSGNVKLSLWNDDATRFKVGDKVKIVNGYVSEFQGENQLTSGKFGSIEKLEGSEEVGSEGASAEGAGSEAPVEAPVDEGMGGEAPAEPVGEAPMEAPAEMPEESIPEEPIKEEVI
jgi:ssDNA-binding replication factor A large subunit